MSNMSKSNEQIVVPLSKLKLVLIFIGSLFFVAIGLWFVISTSINSNNFMDDQFVLLIIGIVSILFFGIVFIFIARKLFDNKPGLVINSMGLVDNSSGVSGGEILWEDIESFSVIEIHRQKLIMLHVKNPQDYIDKQTSSFKRKMMQVNYNMYNTPLSITSNTLQIKFDDLLNILNLYLKESRQ